MSYPPSVTIRFCASFFATAIILLAVPSMAGPSPVPAKVPRADKVATRPFVLIANETKRPEPDIDLFALMSGKCSKVKIAGRDFTCRAVAYFHSEQGRANFTIALDDPADTSHIVSFSGENARREQDNLYELTVDQMLLNSKDRPKVDGLPVPSVELSAGACKQVGSFATGQVSSVSCNAVDRSGKSYELQFESDGSPMTVRKIRHRPLNAEKSRGRRTEQIECRSKASVDRILPRDLTAYIIRCLAQYNPEDTSQDAQKPATDGQQPQ
jgi:hypothetical protein